MEHRVVNIEERIGKQVGSRVPPDPLRVPPNDIEESRRWCELRGGIRGRPGVYRFKTHEEADLWMIRQRIRRP